MSHKFDLLIIALFPAFIAPVLLYLNANFITSTILTFGPPSLWLSIRQPGLLKKITMYSAIFSLPFTFIIDYIVTKDFGWYIVDSIFSIRLFNLVVIEQFLWGFLYIFLIVSFYKYFLDTQTNKPILTLTPGTKLFSRIIFSILLVFIGFVTFLPDYLYLPYSYLILGTILGIIPLLTFLFNYPIFITRFAKAIPYFAYLAILNECVSLKLGHWIFPGTNYIGFINIYGFQLPYEEFIFYFILAAPTLLAYYEFIADDRK